MRGFVQAQLLFLWFILHSDPGEEGTVFPKIQCDLEYPAPIWMVGASTSKSWISLEKDLLLLEWSSSSCVQPGSYKMGHPESPGTAEILGLGSSAKHSVCCHVSGVTEWPVFLVFLVQHCRALEGEALGEKDHFCVLQACQLLTGFTGS